MIKLAFSDSTVIVLANLLSAIMLNFRMVRNYKRKTDWANWTEKQMELEAEDETSLKKHIEYMQNEWCKASPDQEKLRKRMVLIFPGRRRMMNAQLPLVGIRSEFPALFCQEEASFFVYCVYMHVSAYQNGTDCLCRLKFDFDYCYYQVTIDQPIRLV